MSIRLAVIALLLATLSTAAQDVSPKPITTFPGNVGDLLRKWQAEGTAAGNVGDFYDNRDRGHSILDISRFPQLQMILYTPDERKANHDWAGARVVLAKVVFGNSSTSAAPTAGGSNARRYYTHPNGLPFLYQQYSHNNLYIYPEHRDHDPGHNGPEGYGDLFPTNTPYVIISQGSSGSDQFFMQGMAFALAALRPEVKKKLIDEGMLMPAMQMLLRMSNKNVAGDKEYLLPRAHPTVFEPMLSDSGKMVDLAHSITIDKIPPIARLRVLDEDQAVSGRDFFDPGFTEKLADTPGAIARIHRSTKRDRSMTISAEDSRDVNGRKLTYHWVVLRGDEKRINIRPLNNDKTAAQITVQRHERRPIAPGAALESNRVDIGVFVHNGAYYSAPAFVTVFSLDDEVRRYDDSGRILEIGYGVGESTIAFKDPAALLQVLRGAPPSPGASLILSEWTDAQKADLARIDEEYAAKLKLAPGQRKNQPPESVFRTERPVFGGVSMLDFVAANLRKLAMDTEFTRAHAAEIASLRKTLDLAGQGPLQQEQRRLIVLGIVKASPDGEIEIPSHPGRPSAYEQSMLARYHSALIAALYFPKLGQSEWRPNYVDPDLAAFKQWRDMYQYAPNGQSIGWIRIDATGRQEFNADGHLIAEKDPQGRCVKAKKVKYERDPARPLRFVSTGEIVEYVYSGKDDFKGSAK